MVRRRQRTQKLATEQQLINSKALTNGCLFEEQYFASPKRKDVKIEISNNEEIQNTCIVSNKNKTSIKSEKSKLRSERAMARVIGVPLATRSQTRTIENYFKANNAAKNGQLKTNSSEDLQTINKNEYFELCEDDTTNDTDNTEFSEETNARFEFHRCLDKLNKSEHFEEHIDMPQICDNIFLHEKKYL